MNIKDIAQEPEATKKNLYGDAIDKSIIQENVQTQMNTEPIYSVGAETLQGYSSFKQYDVMSGAAINNEIDKADDEGDKKYYYLAKDGKQFTSGKTYVVNSATVAVPPADNKDS